MPLLPFFRANDIEVLYLADLLAETLMRFGNQVSIYQTVHPRGACHKRNFVGSFVCLSDVGFSSTKAMVEKPWRESKRRSAQFSKADPLRLHPDYPFVTDPMPNLYFTRDPFSIVGNGIVMSKMFTSTRSRESIYGDYIFKYHPYYSKQNLPFYYERSFPSTIEGGDILVLNQHLLAVGVSERTHPAGIEKLAKNLFYHHDTSFSTVLAFDIPKSRSFMHLDTIFTQVDYDKFTIHEELQLAIKVYEVSKDLKRTQKLNIKPLETNRPNL